MEIIFKGYKCGLNVDYHHAHPLPQIVIFLTVSTEMRQSLRMSLSLFQFSDFIVVIFITKLNQQSFQRFDYYVIVIGWQ